MVRRIVSYDEQHRAELQQEATELTGLSNPNSLQQLKGWLQDQGMPLTSVTKDTIAAALQLQYIPDNVRRMLEIRQALGKTSVAKYSTMLEAVCKDGRLRGILQFYGANRSGRWAGKLVQTHNLARNTLEDLDLARELAASGDFDTMETLFGETAFVFSELIRTAFIPSEGCRFVVSDFSAIEARVIAWIAGESWTLEAFREGKDIYCETASMMYHKPVVKHGVNGELRAKGKVAVLACGYQGGVGAMKRMDKEGVIPEEELQSVVDQWRDANPHIVKLWRTCELAARMAINEHRTIRIQHGIQFSYINGNLFVQLPCGRKLCYWDTRLKIDSETGREQIVYMGVNQDTKQWGETETYGGKLVENIVQATARDCLAMAMTRVSALGYKIVMHVHDEMIVDVPIEDKDALKKINDIMAQSIDWAPGLPLRGDGYETPFYKKD
jgi:DNA polymerase